MRVRGRRLFKAAGDAFGKQAFAKVIKLHVALHAADAYEETGPIDENSDQAAEAKQADVKGAARQTNYNTGMEVQMGTRFARQMVVDQQQRVERMTASLLCRAAKEGKLIELNWLLAEGGANPDSKYDDGVSALSSAAERGHTACVTSLLSNGANADTQDKGATPIISACMAACWAGGSRARGGILWSRLRHMSGRLGLAWALIWAHADSVSVRER